MDVILKLRDEWSVQGSRGAREVKMLVILVFSLGYKTCIVFISVNFSLNHVSTIIFTYYSDGDHLIKGRVSGQGPFLRR